MKIEALENNVVLLPLEPERVTTGGLMLPDSTREISKMGKVISVGPGIRNYQTGDRIEMSVKIDDIVTFPQFAGQRLEHKGEEYVVIKENDLLTKLVDE